MRYISVYSKKNKAKQNSTCGGLFDNKIKPVFNSHINILTLLHWNVHPNLCFLVTWPSRRPWGHNIIPACDHLTHHSTAPQVNIPSVWRKESSEHITKKKRNRKKNSLQSKESSHPSIATTKNNSPPSSLSQFGDTYVKNPPPYIRMKANKQSMDH